MDNQQQTLSVSAVDIDEMEMAISGLPLEINRLTTNARGVAFTSTSVGEVGVLAGEFGFPVASEGDVASDALVVALQLEDGPGSWDGEDFSLDRAWIYEPGSEHAGVGLSTPGGRPPRFATVSLPVPAGVRDHPRRSSPMVQREHVRALRGVVLDVVAAAHGGGLGDDRARLIERELIQIAHVLRSGDIDARVDRTSATWITQECLALAESLGPLPSTVDLAAGIGVSDRWVRAAFRKVYGVSASAFFRARAIEGARRELRSATPDSTSVTEVAMRSGFWHLGRFSATYRSYVGERPSETLGRID